MIPEHSSCRIYGIYNDGPLGDGIIAMNFAQTLDVQHYQSDMFGGDIGGSRKH